MDEFHSFNDRERGIVWELSLVLLPKHVRVMLLSATVGNPNEFATWLATKHGRKIRVILSEERRVPLEFNWIEDQLLTEQLATMVTDNDETNRSPALVFCFNRDECWDVAEKMKGLKLIGKDTRAEIEAFLDERSEDLQDGVGPKLRQMLVRGVGVHHGHIRRGAFDYIEGIRIVGRQRIAGRACRRHDDVAIHCVPVDAAERKRTRTVGDGSADGSGKRAGKA